MRQVSTSNGIIIFLFLTQSLVSVPIIVENRAFLNFGGVGVGVVIPGVVGFFVFVFLTSSLIYVPIFVENRAFLNFGGVGWVGVAVGRLDRHFRFPRTEFSLCTNFR